jgi:hypothetical protein
MKIKIIRNIPKFECSWLNNRIKKGEEFYIYYGYTYGAISKNGIAVTEKKNKTPFFEIPLDSFINIPIDGKDEGGI